MRISTNHCFQYKSISLQNSSDVMVKQKSLANAKGNVRQQCMFEGPLQTNLSSLFPATDIGYDVFTYARWHHHLEWMLPFEWLNASILKRVFKFHALIQKIP